MKKSMKKTMKNFMKNITNIEKKHKGEKVIFVFYTFFDTKEPASWSYSKFPKGWWWVGSGRTVAFGEKKIMYENEEQFSGPKNTQEQMITYLTTFFNKLKDKKYIKRFTIKKSFIKAP